MMGGKVLDLFIAPKESDTRISKETISLDHNGVVDDKFYKKDLNRSILITSIHSYNIAKSHNITIEYGKLGENILVDIDISSLNIGDYITIGDASLQITQSCTICKGLSSVDCNLPEILAHDRGIFAKVINTHKISVNDTVSIK